MKLTRIIHIFENVYDMSFSLIDIKWISRKIYAIELNCSIYPNIQYKHNIQILIFILVTPQIPNRPHL